MSFGFWEISSHGPFKEEYFILIYRTGYACDAMGNRVCCQIYTHCIQPYSVLVVSSSTDDAVAAAVLFANAKLA